MRQVVDVAAAVVKHEHTKAVARNAAYVGVGAYAVFRRLWDGRTTAQHERYMRAAERGRGPRGGAGVGEADSAVP